MKKRSCRLDHAVFLASDLDTGSLSLQVDVLDASNINAFSVSEMGESRSVDSVLARFKGEKFFGDIDAREIFTPYECQQSFLNMSMLGKERTLRSGICIRKYVKAKDLYDVSFSWYDFEGPLKTKVSISHTGVSLETSQKLLSYWAGRFK
ncbi:MAG: hypothetical protein R3A80_06295 [Bdellovibrionota bacterium]